MRSAFAPSGRSDQRTASQEMIAMPASETVYTFSFTTDWFHTVNAVAPISAPSVAPVRRCQRSCNQPRSTFSVTRNQTPAAIALQIAANTLILAATDPATGNNENTRPMMTKKGFPGGCGRPNVYAAAMYSLVSHMAVDGAIVTRYSTRITNDAIAATPYDGRSAGSTRSAVGSSPP